MPDFAVEIVFALAERQSLTSVSVKSGDTVADVVSRSGLSAAFSEFDFDNLALGIWGRAVAGDQMVKKGDRIEIYRPLKLDPREARRQLALSGRTMSNGPSD